MEVGGLLATLGRVSGERAVLGAEFESGKLEMKRNELRRWIVERGRIEARYDEAEFRPDYEVVREMGV